MKKRLALLAALVPLLSPAVRLGGDTVPADLELASLAVTDGIAGGIIGPMPYVLLAAGYDRVEHGFRAVRRKKGADGDEVWTAELEPAQFRALLELAVASGLPALPLENPPGCADVYGQARQIRLSYGKVQWANGAPGGCVRGTSTVVPSEDERHRFDEVVARLERAVDALALRRSSGTELLRVPFLSNARVLDNYRRAMEFVLAHPERHRLDLEHLWAAENRVSFCWRGRAPDECGGDVDFVIDRSGKLQRAPSAPRSTIDHFVPLETGMTLADVLARLGQPDERQERADGSLVLTYLASRQNDDRIVQIERLNAPLLCGVPFSARLRFEDGRLSAP